MCHIWRALRALCLCFKPCFPRFEISGLTALRDEFPRIKRLPPYVFNIVGELKAKARARGEDIIDFGMGNPDQPTPQHIVDKLVEAAQRIPRLRRAIAHWYKKRYNVELDQDSEAIVTIGSKEGLAHLALATMGPGDVALVPNPSYPIHPYGFVIAGADIRHVSLVPGVDFFEELEKAIKACWPQPKMLVLNFPGNPTTQCVELDFFEKVVAIAREHQIWVIHDLAYADIVFDGYVAPSILQVPGAKDVAVEFFTLSKSYNMPGWRVGFMCGNSKLVAALARMKSYMDYGTAGLCRGDPRPVSQPARCVVQESQLHRLAGNAAQGGDVRLGAHPRALSAFGIAGIFQEAAGRGQGGGIAGYRLR